MDIDEEKAAARKVGEYGGYVEVEWFTELDGRAVYRLRRPGYRAHGCVGLPFLVSVGDDGVGYELRSDDLHRAMGLWHRQSELSEQIDVHQQPVDEQHV